MEKIYTKFGDEGKTHACDNAVVCKTDVIIEFYGVLDELNCFLGLAKESLRENKKFLDVFNKIENIQKELFTFPSLISSEEVDSKVLTNMIQRLETEMDSFDIKLPSISSFLLPGGSESSARLHISRAICRRAERVLFHYMRNYNLNMSAKKVAIYLNRLSDWLYVVARLVIIL